MELKSNKRLSVFSLVMINVIAICSLRSLPFSATFGWYLIPIYLIAAIGFLMPIAAISSFFASRFPVRGGLYVWVREALGLKFGFLAIWLQWVYNVLWYPTAMVFVVETLLYGLNIQVSRIDLIEITTILFWLITIANCFGMKISSWISIIGAMLGTFIPIILLIFLAIIWAHSGNHIAITGSNDWHGSLPLLVTIIFGLMGIEMSCVHANDVNNPKKSYPKALFLSCAIIVTILAFSSLAIATIVPHETLNVLNGANQAFSIVLEYSKLSYLKPIVMGLIALGGLACIGAWVIGPSKGLFVASSDKCLPSYFNTTNKHEVPQRLLITQALLVTVLNIFYLYMPSVEQAYEIMSIATSQLAILTYLILLYAGFKFHTTNMPGYEVPGGRKVFKKLCCSGFIISLTVLIIGFQPPASIKATTYKYDLWLIFWMIVLIAPAFALTKGKK